ncbi:hypothetical protein AAT19DRAFT_14490 [Rhodotorula toruloides]|uniref:HAT C-terminal dimerisation domain-containing protein n=1 Tax=Rhodotorula toruloides TaxID=5286 RepID=A0A2T0A805_RHOTO|nr:hypothetical protein AAT19DRAFT_14490 [Rhodotorula toruloides]
MRDRVIGVVSDSAATMRKAMILLGEKGLERSAGLSGWLRCFAHVLNLITKAILSPFKKAPKAASTELDATMEEPEAYEPTFEEIVTSFVNDRSNDEDAIINLDLRVAQDAAFAQLLKEVEEEEGDSHLQEREESAGAVYTAKSAKLTLAKFHQLHGSLPIKPRNRLGKMDFRLVRDLVAVLEPLASLTSLVSTAKMSRLGDAICLPRFTTPCCEAGGCCKSIIRSPTTRNYKRDDNVGSAQSEEMPPPPPKRSRVAAHLACAALAPSHTSSDPLQSFINDSPLVNADKSPKDPFAYWIQEREAGREHGGLTELALDLFSAPTVLLAVSSVAVERAFSVGRAFVTEKRHGLAARSICEGLALGAWSRADMVPERLLADSKEMRKAGKVKMSGLKAVGVADGLRTPLETSAIVVE